MYQELVDINTRPKPFEFYTTRELWTNDHTSKMMLSFHLNQEVDASSRNIQFIEKSVHWLCEKFNINNDIKIADFGCGPGLYSSRLAQKNAVVSGIDFSQRSIDYANNFAKENNLTIQYINQDYLKFDTSDKYDLIIMIMCDFCALSPHQRRKLLDNFYSLLKLGGHMVLDVYSLKGFDEKKEISIYEKNLLNGFWSSNEYFGFLNTFKYDNAKVTLDKYTIIEKTGKKTIYNWLQYFSIESLEDEFRNAGLKIQDTYKNVAGEIYDSDHSEFAVVVKKS